MRASYVNKSVMNWRSQGGGEGLVGITWPDPPTDSMNAIFFSLRFFYSDDDVWLLTLRYNIAIYSALCFIAIRPLARIIFIDNSIKILIYYIDVYYSIYHGAHMIHTARITNVTLPFK